MINHLQWDQTQEALPRIKVVVFVTIAVKRDQDVFFRRCLRRCRTP